MFAVLAVGSFLFSLLFRKMYEDLMRGDYTTQGRVTGQVQGDRGSTAYYVAFTHVDGTLMEGKSIHYKHTKNKYGTGSYMNIQYSLNPKGQAQVIVLDSTITPTCNSTQITARNLVIASVVFLIIALILLIKHLVL